LDSLFEFGTTVFQGIQRFVSGTDVEVVRKRGCDIDGNSNPEEIEETIQEATNSDVVILCMGETHYTELFGNIDGLLSINKKHTMKLLLSEH